MVDSYSSAGRCMERFKFFILLILSVSAFLICHGCGGGGGGGSSGSPAVADTSGSINLAWEASSDSAVVGHWVYYQTGSFTEQKRDAGPTPGPGITIFYTLEGLSKGQTYSIAVTAYDRYRNESNRCGPVSGDAK